MWLTPSSTARRRLARPLSRLGRAALLGTARLAEFEASLGSEPPAATALGSPQRAGGAGGAGDQGCQLGPVGYRERDVGAAAAAGWSAVGLRREAAVRE